MSAGQLAAANASTRTAVSVYTFAMYDGDTVHQLAAESEEVLIDLLDEQWPVDQPPIGGFEGLDDRIAAIEEEYGGLSHTDTLLIFPGVEA